MTDSGEGFDGLGRHAVESGASVAEPLGHGAPHLEVEGAARVRRDVAIHLFDLGLELARVDFAVHARDVKRVPARSPGRTPEICRDFASRGRCRSGRCKPV
jgi:hypothetical protein